MRYLLFVSLLILCVVVVFVASAIALPCVTVHVHIANKLNVPVAFALVSRETELLSGTLEGREEWSLPLVVDLAGSDLILKATPQERDPMEEAGFYMIGFPHDDDIHAFVISNDGVLTLQVQRPFLSAFRSDNGRVIASVFQLLTDSLRCLDSAESRRQVFR